jgi:hypothetical protein
MTTPAEIAAGTALLNASLVKAVDPNVYALARDFLNGTATFFGKEMTDTRGFSAHTAIVMLLEGAGIDVDRMHEHYFTLVDNNIKRMRAALIG